AARALRTTSLAARSFLLGVMTQSPDIGDVNALSIDSDQALLVQTRHGARDDLANGADSGCQLLLRDAQFKFNGVALLSARLCLVEKRNSEPLPDGAKRKCFNKRRAFAQAARQNTQCRYGDLWMRLAHFQHRLAIQENHDRIFFGRYR